MKYEDRISAAKTINGLHQDLMGIAEDVLSRMIEIGEKLHAVKGSLHHGRWETWVKLNLKFSVRTARRYLKAYAQRDNDKLKNNPEEFIPRLYGNGEKVTIDLTRAVPETECIQLRRVDDVSKSENRTLTSEVVINLDVNKSEFEDRQIIVFGRASESVEAEAGSEKEEASDFERWSNSCIGILTRGATWRTSFMSIHVCRYGVITKR